tara:strand:+ start:1786 stop:2601 length:816 start_codon:yes stop_codon:yes gene_type:complete
MNAKPEIKEAEPVAVTHKNVWTALAAAQSELKNPEKTKDGKVSGVSKTGARYEYTYKYADIGDVLEASLPVLSAHGLSVTQPTIIRENAIVLATRLTHGESGTSLESEYPVCAINVNHQSMGAAMTYARRYALTSLLGIAAVDDTDGEGAAPSGEGERVKMSSHQAKTEINWEAIEAEIDGAETFLRLDKIAGRVESRKGIWPDTYYHKARERILTSRMDLANAKMAKAKDPDELSNAFADMEGALDGKVPYDDLAGMYRLHETRIENGGE